MRGGIASYFPPQANFFEYVDNFTEVAVNLGLGRIVALHHRSSASCQIR